MPKRPVLINVTASATSKKPRGATSSHEQSQHQPSPQPSASFSLKPSGPLKKRFLPPWDIPSSSKALKIAHASSPSTSHQPAEKFRRHPTLLLTDDGGNFVPNPLALPSGVPRPSPLAIPSWIRGIDNQNPSHPPSVRHNHCLPGAPGSPHGNARIFDVGDTGASTLTSNCHLVSRPLGSDLIAKSASHSRLVEPSGPFNNGKTAGSQSAPFLSDCDLPCAPVSSQAIARGTLHRDQRLSQSLEQPGWSNGESTDRTLQRPPEVQQSQTEVLHPAAHARLVARAKPAPKPSASTDNPSSSNVGRNGEVVSVVYKSENTPKSLPRGNTEHGDLELMDVTSAPSAFRDAHVNRSRPMNSRNPTSIPQRPRETIRPANAPQAPEEEDVVAPASPSRILPQTPASPQMASTPSPRYQPHVLSPPYPQPTTPLPSTHRSHVLPPSYPRSNTPLSPPYPRSSTPLSPAYPRSSTPLSPVPLHQSIPLSPVPPHQGTPLSPASPHLSTPPSPSCRSPVLSAAACSQSNSFSRPLSPLPKFSPLPPACPMPPPFATFHTPPSALLSPASTNPTRSAPIIRRAPSHPPAHASVSANARSVALAPSLAPNTPHGPNSLSLASEQDSREGNEKVIKVGRRAGTVHYWRSSLQMPKGSGAKKSSTREDPTSKSCRPSERAPMPSCRRAVPIAPAPNFPPDQVSQRLSEASGTRPASVVTDSALAPHIPLLFRNHRFWRHATKLPSMTPEEALVRRHVRKMGGDNWQDETGVSETRANEEGTAASQVGGLSGSTIAGIDEQEDDMCFIPQMTLNEEQYAIRRLFVMKDYELKKLESDAESKYHMKMNLRGRQKLENWLASGDPVASSSVKYLVLTLNQDRRLVSDESKERQDALEDLDNRMLRKLEALKMRTSTRDGRTNWSLLTANFIGDENQVDQ